VVTRPLQKNEKARKPCGARIKPAKSNSLLKSGIVQEFHFHKSSAHILHNRLDGQLQSSTALISLRAVENFDE
jgi:hypothetical protein